LVQKSTVYATIIGQRIEEQRAARAKQEERAKKAVAKGKPVAASGAGNKKRKRAGDEILNVDKNEVDTMAANKRAKLENTDVVHETSADANGEEKEEEKEEFQAQSPAITGAKLRDYQLAGVQWLSTLHANGLNGILGMFSVAFLLLMAD
jgi:ATP-dependent DNA helicase